MRTFASIKQRPKSSTVKESHMTKKEQTIKLLLQTSKKYSEIAAEVSTTEKSVAFYAHQLRKVDKQCLAHRETARAESVQDLLAKYSAPVSDETSDETEAEVSDETSDETKAA